MKDFLWRRRMRRRARKEMREESTVWREYKKNRSSTLRRWINTDLNSGLSGMVVVLILTAFAVNAEPKPYRMLLAFSFLGTSIILFRSAALFSELFQSAARSTMFAMPISDRDYLSLQLRRYSKKSISTFLYFLICYGVALDQIGRTDFFWRFGIPAALMQACLAVALTILILRFPILLYKGWITTVAFLAAMAAVWAPADAIRSLWSLSLVSPVAWVNQSFIGFFGVGNSYSRYLMFAAVAILALAWREYLRTFESTAATLELQAADIADVSLPTFTASEATDEEFENSEAPSTSYSVETRQVATPLTDTTRIELNVPEWRSQSWLDRLVFSTLTKRELILAELMLGAKRTSFTGAYVSAVAIAAVGFILCFIPSAPASLLFWPLIIAAIVGTPLVGGRWIGFEGPVNVGIKLPIFALFPVSY